MGRNARRRRAAGAAARRASTGRGTRAERAAGAVAAEDARREARHRRTLVLVSLFAALALALVLLLVGRLWSATPSAVRISASVHEAGDVSMRFADLPSDTTSPACGCYHHKPPGGWRGIVLPAQDLVIDHRGSPGKRGMAYDISSAAPASLGTHPSQFELPVSVAVIAVPRSKAGVDPATLSPDDMQLAYQENILRDWLTILVDGPLHVRSAAREPIAALSPPADRLTTLHHGESGSLQIKTSFNPQATHRTGQEVNGVPVLDVLGPEITMWGSIDGVKNPISYSAWGSPVPARGGVSLDLGVSYWAPPRTPRAPRGWVKEVLVLTGAPMFAARLAMKPAALDASLDTQADLSSASGTVTVSVPDAEQNAAALAKKFRWTNKHPVVWLRDVPTIPNTDDMTTRSVKKSGEVESGVTDAIAMEYPPTPPRSGINVFGAISELRFATATADVTVGSKPLSYRARTPFELRDIYGTGVLKHHMIVPVRIFGKGAQIDVVGKADARINGRPLATERPWLAGLLTSSSIGWFLGVASAILSFLVLLVVLKQPAGGKTTG